MSTATIPDDVRAYDVSLEELTGCSDKNRSPSNYALGGNRAGRSTSRSRLVSRIEQSQRRAGRVRHADRRFRFAFDTAWKVAREGNAERRSTRLHRLHTEPWRRWANGFSCLCFVMIGVPVAVWLRLQRIHRQLLHLLPADPGRVLSAAGGERRPGERRRIAAAIGVARQLSCWRSRASGCCAA